MCLEHLPPVRRGLQVPQALQRSAHFLCHEKRRRWKKKASLRIIHTLGSTQHVWVFVSQVIAICEKLELGIMGQSKIKQVISDCLLVDIKCLEWPHISVFILNYGLPLFQTLMKSLFSPRARNQDFLPFATEWKRSDDGRSRRSASSSPSRERSAWEAEAIKHRRWSFIRLHQKSFWKLWTLSFGGSDSGIINVHFSKWHFSNRPFYAAAGRKDSHLSELLPCGHKCLHVHECHSCCNLQCFLLGRFRLYSRHCIIHFFRWAVLPV